MAASLQDLHVCRLYYTIPSHHTYEAIRFAGGTSFNGVFSGCSWQRCRLAEKTWTWPEYKLPLIAIPATACLQPDALLPWYKATLKSRRCCLRHHSGARGSRPESSQVGEGSFGKALLVRSEAGSVPMLCVSIRDPGWQDGQKLICKMVDVSKASRKEMEDALPWNRFSVFLFRMRALARGCPMHNAQIPRVLQA